MHPKVDIIRLHKFFLVRVKKKVENPDFALVVKVIFNGERLNSIQVQSFVKHADQYPKVVHIEVWAYQALEVTSELRKIIKLEAFQR